MLNQQAEWKAAQRERAHLTEFLASHSFRPKDLAAALDELDLVKPLFSTEPFFTIHFNKVKGLVQQLEETELGEVFGLFLH